MKKTIYQIALIGVLSLSMISCENLPDIENNVPVIRALKDNDVRAESMVFTVWASSYSSNSYFRVAETPSLENYQTVYAYGYESENGGYNYRASIDMLQPGTKYYYQFVLVGSSFNNNVESEWKEVTTESDYRQTIIWNKNYTVYLGQEPFILDAFATSKLPVSYAITEGKEYATLSGDYGQEFTPKKNGTVIVTASQEGGALNGKTYFPASPVSKQIVINDNKLIISDVVVDDWNNQNGGSSNVEI